MLELVAVILPVACVGVYVVLSSIEIGASLLQLRPRLVGTHASIPHLISPFWETSNLFLLVAIVSTVMLYPSAGPVLASHLRGLLGVVMVLIALRATTICWILVNGVKAGRNFVNALLVAASLAIPIILSQVAVQLLGGNLVDNTAASIATGLAAFVATLVLGLSFFAGIAPPHGHIAIKRLAGLQHKLAMLLAGLVTLVLPPVLGSLRPGFVSQNLVGVLFLVTAILGIGYYLADRVKHSLAQFSVLVTYVLIVLALYTAQQLPYIIYPSSSLSAAFTVSQITKWALIPAAFAFALGIVWVYRAIAKLEN